MKKFFFISGRVALFYGLESLNFKNNDIVLLPSIICEEALIPFRELNIKFKFYKVQKNLFPDWKDVYKNNTRNVKAILMIHYFGFPNDLFGFIKFKKKTKKILIEDYTHGIDGKYQNYRLGKIGNISILSPRKILPINSGGILQFNDKNLEPNFRYSEIKKYSISKKNFLLSKIKQLSISQYLKTFLKNNNLYFKKALSPKFLNEKKKIDENSLQIFKKRKLFLKKRSKNFVRIISILKLNKFDIIYDLDLNINPWHIPFYIKSKKQLSTLSQIKKKYNLTILNWPKFPKEVNSKIIKNNKRIYCVTLY